MVAYWPHEPKVAGPIPVGATNAQFFISNCIMVTFSSLLVKAGRFYLIQDYMEATFYMGIDPGTNNGTGKCGGIAVLNNDGTLCRLDKMPETPQDILDYLKNWSGCHIVCVLEDVGHGIPGQSSSATAKFARHNGHLEMALLALGMTTEKVTPQKWQKIYQLGSSKGVGKAAWKNKLKAKAQQLFPQAGKSLTLNTCDALLIAEYGRRTL